MLSKHCRHRSSHSVARPSSWFYIPWTTVRICLRALALDKRLKQLWKTAEWKKRRAELITPDTICEKCDSKEFLSIHHPHTMTLKRCLRKVYSNFYRQHLRQFGIIPDSATKFLNKLILELEAATLYELELIKYLKFDDVEIICRRCHFAVRKGMNICPVCKKHYKKKRYKTCFSCKN
jgi:hypothetical protein